MKHANTEHDETYNRLHWHGSECSDDMRSPKRSQEGAALKETFIPELGIMLPHGTIWSGTNSVTATRKGSWR